jgi:hypothetical protein
MRMRVAPQQLITLLQLSTITHVNLITETWDLCVPRCCGGFCSWKWNSLARSIGITVQEQGVSLLLYLKSIFCFKIYVFFGNLHFSKLSIDSLFCFSFSFFPRFLHLFLSLFLFTSCLLCFSILSFRLWYFSPSYLPTLVSFSYSVLLSYILFLFISFSLSCFFLCFSIHSFRLPLTF